MKNLFAATLLSLAAAVPASAALMTFDNLPGEYASLFSTYTENGMTLTLTSGFANKASIGDPSAPGVVSYGYNIGYDLVAVGGNDFVFQGFGLVVPFREYTEYTVSGSRDGGSVFSYGVGLTTNSIFELQSSPSGLLVDRVSMTFNNFGRVQGSSTIDSISFVISEGQTGPGTGPGTGGVPEPLTWAMMLMGFGMTGGALRASRRRRILPA